MFERLVTVNELHFAVKAYETIPALNIEELLAEKPWSKGHRLSQEQQRDISQGIKFLDLVIKGEKAVEQTRTRGIVSGDIDAVDAYDTTQKALQQYVIDHSELGFDKIIKTSKKVLQVISSQEKLRHERISTVELDVAHDLFLLLSREFLTTDRLPPSISMGDE